MGAWLSRAASSPRRGASTSAGALRVGDVVVVDCRPYGRRPYAVAVADLQHVPRRLVLIEVRPADGIIARMDEPWTFLGGAQREARVTVHPDFAYLDIPCVRACGGSRVSRIDLVRLLSGAFDVKAFNGAPWALAAGGRPGAGAALLCAVRWRLERPAVVVQRAWRAWRVRRDERRRAAAARIADAWLAATYAPGGPGWRRVMARLRATLIVC